MTIVLTNLGRLIGLGSFITGWVYKVYSHQYSKTIAELSPLMQLLGLIELIVASLAYVNVSISMDFQKTSHVGLFNKAYELDKMFIEKFNVSFSYGKEIRKNTLNTRLLMFYCGIYYTASFIIMDPEWRVVLMAIGYAVFTLGALSSGFAHISLMDFLHVRFKLFRSLFEKYISSDLDRNKEQQRHLYLLINHFRKYCELINGINAVYGHSVMVNYLHDFTQTSCIAFVLCHMALESQASSLEYLLLLMFVLPRILKMVYMAACAREAILELKSCLQFIATYDDHCSSKHAKNVVDEILMWKKLNQFHFYIGSTLQLNFGLVYEFFFGVGNYVLILIQLKFQETSIRERLGGLLKTK